MEEEKLSVIERGFRDSSDDVAHGETIRRGYEKELARLLLREMGTESKKLFVAEMPDLFDSENILSRVRKLVPRGESGARFAKYFTELYYRFFGAPTLDEVFATETEDDGEGVSYGVAFVSGGNIDLSYSIFERNIAFSEKVYPVHTQRLSSACDAVAGGDAGFAVIPVRSAGDGRLRSFYRMIDSYDLKIVSACTIGTDENEMRYALCTRSYRPLSESPEFVEIMLPADGEEALAVAIAAMELGYKLTEMSSSPSERDGEIYSFTFSAKVNCIPLILYMNLYHPRYTLLGLYDIINE